MGFYFIKDLRRWLSGLGLGVWCVVMEMFFGVVGGKLVYVGNFFVF